MYIREWQTGVLTTELSVNGHIGADLITLASMLRIPVNKHNVDEKDIFRPSAWAAFGAEKEGSDYRACKTYVSLYGIKE